MSTEDYLNDDYSGFFDEEPQRITKTNREKHDEYHYDFRCSHCRTYGTDSWGELLSHYSDCPQIAYARSLEQSRLHL